MLCFSSKNQSTSMAASTVSHSFFLLLLLSASAFADTGMIGINYGRIANNLPTPEKVVALLKSQGVDRIKLYDTDSTVLTALANSNISVVVALPNELLSSAAGDQSFADNWSTPVNGSKSQAPAPSGDENDVSKANVGQTWCVANGKAGDEKLQKAIDYACGEGGADCRPIQDGSTCYDPNTLEAHASYAFNSYYQKNSRKAGSCDFGGAAYVVTQSPRYGNCEFPTGY
ncbi:hypothetical protein LWI28_001264 [Acer negundo]|uniref:glucan endo-1,3-beta-D-glucosidase n=1 Tax=Acer negundo TaxID=4023 RepID=A0AAD5J337_ACENE|nr:hypothetical protein LWI28_001264 [Acer negundo]